MKSIRPSALLLALVFAAVLPPAVAADPCTDACQALVREGQALQAQGKAGAAFEKFKAASAAAPGASLPASSAAALMYSMSTTAAPEQAAKLRAGARGMASQAARLAPTDPVAQEVLRLLDDGPPPPLHAPSAAIAAIRNEAEVLFAERRYAEALAKYQEVMRADPAYSTAWVNAGDCYYMQKEWAQAEAMFRRATEIEPQNAQAWRFLADALGAQGKRDASEAALLAAIAVDPSQRPNWTKLGALRAAGHTPLQHLALRRGSRVTQGADRKFTVVLEDWVNKNPPTPDSAVRLGLALAEANARQAAAGKPLDAFQVELAAWRRALTIADELKTGTGTGLADPALVQMQALARDGQLEPAILLLEFRQAYRPALVSWLAAHPDGIKAFVDRYGLQP